MHAQTPIHQLVDAQNVNWHRKIAYRWAASWSVSRWMHFNDFGRISDSNTYFVEIIRVLRQAVNRIFSGLLTRRSFVGDRSLTFRISRLSDVRSSLKMAWREKLYGIILHYFVTILQYLNLSLGCDQFDDDNLDVVRYG